MGNSRIIAVVISVALLLGQCASVLHAVSHFPADHPHSDIFLQHLDHNHEDHGPNHVHAVSYIGINVDERESDEHSELICLIYHLHGSAQASLTAPMEVLLQHSIVDVSAVEVTRTTPRAITGYKSIRGPPVVS